MNRIRNIIIVNDFNYVQGGASKVAIQTANLLKESNPNINVYFFSGASKEDTILNKDIINVCTNQGEFLKYYNRIKGMKNGIYNKVAKKEFKKLLDSLKKDETVIHVHGWTKCLSTSIFDVAHKEGFKLFLTMHDYFTACPNGGYYNYKKNHICRLKPMSLRCLKCNCDSRNYIFKLYRVLRQKKYNKSFKNLKNVIAISDFSLNILKKTLPSNVNVTRINNPIEFDLKTKEINPSKNNYYLYVGRVSKEKGVELFCQAISELKLQGVVVGDGDQKDLLAKQYPQIKFVGWKSEKEVKDYMRKAKCLIFPSKIYEVAPLTNLEALSVGLPSLVSNCCAAKDNSNSKNNTGDTFDIDIESIKNTILNYEVKNKYSRKLLEEFSYDNYVKQLMKLYKK